MIIEYNNELKKYLCQCDICKKEFFLNKKSALLKEEQNSKYLCKSCITRENGKKSNCKIQNNKTHKKYWVDQGFSEEEAKIKVSELKKICVEYWIKNGFSNEEALIKANEHRLSSNAYNKEYWIKKGFSEEESIQKAENKRKELSESCKHKEMRRKNQLTKEYWIEKGFDDKSAKEQIIKFQCHIRDIRDKAKLSNSLKKAFSLKSDLEKSLINSKISISNKSNIFKSPIFKEYWINEGYSEEEAKRLAYLNKTPSKGYGNNSSKIERECLDWLESSFNIYLDRQIFRTINGNNYSFDGKIDQLIIEFNGTNVHLDPRVYNKDDISFRNIPREIVKDHDIKKYLDILSKYSLCVIWEKDYRENKEQIINKSLKFLIND